MAMLMSSARSWRRICAVGVGSISALSRANPSRASSGVNSFLRTCSHRILVASFSQKSGTSRSGSLRASASARWLSGSCRTHLSPTDASTTSATISRPCAVAPASGLFWCAPLQGAGLRRAIRACRFAGEIRPGARRPAVVDQPDGLHPRSGPAEESPDAPLPRSVRARPPGCAGGGRHRYPGCEP